MKFEHNEERDRYIAASGSIVLNACPGSGKTTCIAYKVTELTKDWKSKFFGIACLSFTNVAKDEINYKFNIFSGKTLTFPHVVSTIDSFMNRYITLPFYDLFIKGFTTRPQILENLSFIDKYSFHHYIVIKNKKVRGEIKQPIQYMYAPSTIETDIDGAYLYNSKKPTLSDTNLFAFNKYCENVKSLQYSKGWLKNSDSSYIALCLLRQYPKLASMLVRRFPYMIIDEAQDTSEIQYAIFDELIKGGLKNIEFVGDPYQSLYEWREARPDLFWKRQNSDAWLDLTLSCCRRSTQTIVNSYSILRKASDKPLISILASDVDEPISILFYSDPTALLEKYKDISRKYSLRAVLVRGSTHLNEFGAKPHHESIWKMEPCVPQHFILGKFELERGRVRDAIKRIRQCLPILIEPGCDQNRQRELTDCIKENPQWNAKIVKLLNSLPDFNLSVENWTKKAEDITHACLTVESKIDFPLKQGKFRPKHKLSIQELFRKAPHSDFVTTIHKAKGKTFDSVMIVLAVNNSGQNICFANIERPDDIPDEKKRMIYVAMSRPRYQLVIAMPKGSDCTESSLRTYFGPATMIQEI